MTDHDPLCPCLPDATGYAAALCRCTFIAKVRADERSRIAVAIEAMDGVAFGFHSPGFVPRDIAAQIARQGGQS